jgi:hypothetical protein
MSDYEDRKQAKVDRFRDFAANARARSDAAYQTSHQISERFAGGQPILVGHHSEGRARRDQARMHGLMDRALAEDRSADYWERRARAVELDKAIERYDPEAQRKITERIEVLEGMVERIREVNAILKRTVTPQPTTSEDACEALLLVDGLSDKEKIELAAYSRQFLTVRKFGYPAYHLTNLNANLRRYKERLKEVTAWQARPAALEVVERKRLLQGRGDRYVLSNGWSIIRDRTRHNQPQYAVWNENEEPKGEEQWTWRNALALAEAFNLPPEIPKPGELVNSPIGPAVVYAVSQDGKTITVDLGESTGLRGRYGHFTVAAITRRD